MILGQQSGTVATLAREYPVLGLALTTHRNQRGEPIALAARPSTVELYTDARQLKDVVIQKAVQVGVSEWAMQFIFDAAGWNGRIAAYVLPTYPGRNRFVQNRVNPLLMSIPAYRDRCPGGAFAEDIKGGAGNLGLKKFGRGALMFLGSETDSDFVEFSADIMFIDEYDSSNQRNIALAYNRLRESPYPQIINVGNPTVPRKGICGQYDETDRRRWFVACSHCNHRQQLDWFQHFIERNDAGRWVARDSRAWAAGDDIRPICARCRRPFDRTAKRALWVAERPTIIRRGYHMSRLDLLSESMSGLLREWLAAQGSPELVARFYKSVLGLGYEFEGARLTVEQLVRASTGQPDMDRSGGSDLSGKVVTAGIDVGGQQHVVISVIERDAEGNAIRHARLVQTVPRVADLADILRKFKVDLAVIDAGPETEKAKELRDEFVEQGGCTVWLCRFHPTPVVDRQKFGMRCDYSAQVCQVDRTAVFDAAYDDIAAGRRFFPGDVFAAEDWSEQMRAPIRIFDEEKQRITWTKGPPDHFRLADIYDRVAVELLDQGGTYWGG